MTGLLVLHCKICQSPIFQYGRLNRKYCDATTGCDCQRLVSNCQAKQYARRNTMKEHESDFVRRKVTPNLRTVTMKRNPLEILSMAKGERYKEYRKLWEDASNFKTETKFPLQLDIDITDSCNRRCGMCLQWKDPGFTKQKMPIEMLDKILNEAKSHGCRSINYGVNTEPILYDTLFIEAMGLMKKYDFEDCFIHTNGIKLSHDVMDSILDVPVSNFSMSLGMMEDDRIQRQIINRIKEFIAYRNNKHSELPIVRVSYIPCDDKQSKNVIDELSDLADYIEEQGLFDCNGIAWKYPMFKQYGHHCHDSWRRFYINAFGDMYQCCNFPAISKHLFHGNVQHRSIFDAWNSKKAQSIRSLTVHDRIPECKECENKYYKRMG